MHVCVREAGRVTPIEPLVSNIVDSESQKIKHHQSDWLSHGPGVKEFIQFQGYASKTHKILNHARNMVLVKVVLHFHI